MGHHQPQPAYYQSQPHQQLQPAYDQPQFQPQPQSQYQPPPAYGSYPSQAYAQQSASPRILHVYHEGFTQRRAHILDSDKRTPVYNIEANSASVFSSKPHMRIHEAATNAEVATITFHSWSSDMDLTVHNNSILLTKSSFMSSAHAFQSPATGGSFKWKRDGMFSGDMICLDEREQTVARFDRSGWAVQKEGKIELMPGVTGVLMTEIVTSGIAMIEYMRRQRQAGAAGGAGGVAAC